MAQNTNGFSGISRRDSSRKTDNDMNSFKAFTLEPDKDYTENKPNNQAAEKFAKFTDDDFDINTVASSASEFSENDWNPKSESGNNVDLNTFLAAPSAKSAGRTPSKKTASGNKKCVPVKKKRSKAPAVIVSALCLVAVLGGCYILGSQASAPYNVNVGLLDVSAANADILFTNSFSDLIKGKTVTIKTEDKSYPAPLDSFDFGFAPEGKVAEEYINTPLPDGSGYSVEKISAIGNLSFNETKVYALISEIAAKYGTPMVLPSYKIEEDTLTVLSGSDGMSVDFNALTEKLSNSIKNMDFSEISVGLGVLKAPAVDMEKIYKEVACQPVNASVSVDDQGKASYVDEIVGKDFDLAAATALVEGSSKKSWDIKLTLTQPEVTVKHLKAPTCPDVISNASTRFNAGNKSRSHNLSLAGEKINGLVLQPGEVFSFNGTVGKRTAENGFKTATVYTGEGLDEDFGGGICQTSTTVYYAAVKANLEIVERKNHYYTVGYWPMPGADATVSWGSCDLKIKNNREYPIRFDVESSSGTITCRVYGTSDGVTAYLENEIYAYKDFETIHKPKDSNKSNSSGSKGMSVKTYRVVLKDDQVISKELEATSVYRPLNAVIYDGDTSSNSSQTTTKPTTTPKPTTPAPADLGQ